jgi:uncharacterized protein YceK
MRIIAVVIILVLTGCAVLTHQAPDGSQTTYMSLGRTDTMKAGDIVLTGKSDIDPTVLISGVVK